MAREHGPGPSRIQKPACRARSASPACSPISQECSSSIVPSCHADHKRYRMDAHDGSGMAMSNLATQSDSYLANWARELAQVAAISAKDASDLASLHCGQGRTSSAARL